LNGLVSIGNFLIDLNLKIKMKFTLNLGKKSSSPPLIEITPAMEGVKRIQYLMGEEIDFKHTQIDLKGLPVAVISYHNDGADRIYVYRNNEWESIGSKKLF
jgi:hypothetical protein